MKKEKMSLNQTIEHCRKIADSYKDTAPKCKSRLEHLQLAKWLEELRELRENQLNTSKYPDLGYPYGEK